MPIATAFIVFIIKRGAKGGTRCDLAGYTTHGRGRINQDSKGKWNICTTPIRTHRNIKVILPQITPRIRSLHDHLLARDGPARERELVAGAAPCLLVGAGELDGGPAVGRGLIDGPGALVGAHVGAAADAVVAAALGIGSAQGPVALVARLHELARVGLEPPSAARLAAVPVPRRPPVARRPLRRR